MELAMDIDIKSSKWDELIDVSNAEYTIIKTDDFLQSSYLKLKKPQP